MNYRLLPDSKTCTGCMGCVDACPRGVLHSEYDNQGFLVTSIEEREKTCIDCGLCLSACPVLELKKEDCGNRQTHQVFAAWSCNRAIRAKSASGGFFAALAVEMLQQGWLVWGAAIDGFQVKHVFISSPDELSALQGSKYAHGDMSGVYRTVVTQLQNGSNVLFSGLPCQCAALRLAIRGLNCDGRLIIVDIVCGGVPSNVPTKIFRKLYPDAVSVVSYRDKDEGWKSLGYHYRLKVRTNSGNVESVGQKNPITYGFVKEIFRRSSCDNCAFSRLERRSDITIGDFWGINEFKDEHYEGISGVMVNTPFGMNVLKSLQTIVLHSADIKAFSKFNHRLMCSKGAVANKEFKRRMFILFFAVKECIWLPTIILRMLFRFFELVEGAKRNHIL